VRLKPTALLLPLPLALLLLLLVVVVLLLLLHLHHCHHPSRVFSELRWWARHDHACRFSH